MCGSPFWSVLQLSMILTDSSQSFQNTPYLFSGPIPVCSCLYVHPGISLFIHCYPTTLGTGILWLFSPSPLSLLFAFPLPRSMWLKWYHALPFFPLLRLPHSNWHVRRHSEDSHLTSIMQSRLSDAYFSGLRSQRSRLSCLVLSCHLRSTCGMRL